MSSRWAVTPEAVLLPSEAVCFASWVPCARRVTMPPITPASAAVVATS